MAANQPPWPREWLMTDERIGKRLWEVMERLPAGAGVVVRHYGTPTQERARLASRIAEICRKRGLTLAVARNVELATGVGAQLVHNPAGDPAGLPFSRSAHSLEEAHAAYDSGASLIFLSPMFSTRSHPEAAPLSWEEARTIVAECPVPVIALGGMRRVRFAEIRSAGFYGWAGIDAWLEVPSRE